ncbi:hypothetical protein E4U32_007255 [Claviceps aff. humidiphila group G2b]|uniref:Uncharacterized protein n=1 Tax=Claviceps arundinis TaxID=1623583 RepID=A0A9P7SV15_9HYPO|nr:hypothetical protein E4U56_006312 [Claviceps arundinis]KAG6068876.1 hypothetical protein E4U32_007255 [Claviceps aff. humidiphila group G2b]
MGNMPTDGNVDKSGQCGVPTVNHTRVEPKVQAQSRFTTAFDGMRSVRSVSANNVNKKKWKENIPQS